MRQTWQRRAKKLGAAAAVFLCAPFLTAPCLLAQTQAPLAPLLKVKTELTLVDVQVLQEKTGNPVGSLRPDDFEVYEDGVQQRVSFLTRDELPLSVVFLFDLTDSVRPVLEPLSDGALDALAHLKPEDEVAVMVYSASAKLLQGFTQDRTLAAHAIERASHMRSNEAAFFNEGVFQAAHEERDSTEAHSRRIIIWLTDNVPNIPDEMTRRRYGKSIAENDLHTEQDAMKELLETGTTVCTLLERSAMSDESEILYNDDPLFAFFRKLNPPGDVHKYADDTGGIVIETGRKKVSAKLAQMIEEIRARYTLGYAPSTHQADGKFCRVEVSVTPESAKSEGKLVVRAMHGYYRGMDAEMQTYRQSR